VTVKPFIEIQGLSKSFGIETVALDSVNLDVRPHEILGLVGANGSGKTTLLRILAGSLAPSAGQIFCWGEKLGITRSGTVKRKLSYASQDPALDPEMTVQETIRFFESLNGGRHSELPHFFEIKELSERPIAKLSGGQRQRVHLALAFLSNPSVLLLDEPTTALDPAIQRSFWNHLRSWINTQRSVLVATHDLKEAEENFDRVAIFSNGKLLQIDRPQNIRAQFARPRLEVVYSGLLEASSPLFAEMKRKFDLESMKLEIDRLQIRFKREEVSIDSILTYLNDQKIEVLESRFHSATFEEAFFALTGLPTSEKFQAGHKKRRSVG